VPARSNYAPPAPVNAVGRAPALPVFQPFSTVLDPEANIVLKIGFGLLLLDIFFTVSRVLEIITVATNYYIPYLSTVIHVVTLFTILLSGMLRPIATSSTGVLLLLFTSWMFICTLFSTWRGGSADTILHQWLPAVTLYFACGLIVTLRQCGKVCNVLGLSVIVIAAASFFVASSKDQRLSFEAGTLGNSNELGFLLLLGSAFFLFPLLRPGASFVSRSFAAAGGLLTLSVAFHTGSRASLLAMIAMLLVLLWTRSVLGKLKLMFTALLVGVMVVALAPAQILQRYSTIFSQAETRADLSNEALASSTVRKELLQESLMVTLQHPLFGVGPGIYAAAMAGEASREGRRARWSVSHNTFTQVSSEMGIPALLLYLAAIWSAFRDALRMRSLSLRNGSGYGDALATALLVSLTCACVSSFFGSNAYVAWLPLLMGLSAAFRLSLQRELERPVAAPAVPTPAVPTQDVARVGQPKPLFKPAPANSYRFLGRRRRFRG